MQLHHLLILSLPLLAVNAIPFVDISSSPNPSPVLPRDADNRNPPNNQRGGNPSPPGPPGGCPSQKPISQNLCTSGSPYCCSGSGSGQVCGPASNTQCTATTICCINTNGMQICAGEIDFTGPVTININL